MTLVYITCKNKKEAEIISMHLLKKRMIACANISPIKSMFWWKGKIESQKEILIMAKTLEYKFERIKEEVSKLHSYTVPCILKIDAESNEKYNEWVRREIK